MTSEPPWEVEESGAFIVTFKGGKGYEEPWLVLRAGSVARLRDRIVEAFDLEDGLTLTGAINNANITFQAMATIRRELGGRVIAQPTTSGSDPWVAAAAAAAEPVDPNTALLNEIEAATTVDQLKRFWVAHNPLNEVIEPAWRAKGKALKEGDN